MTEATVEGFIWASGSGGLASRIAGQQGRSSRRQAWRLEGQAEASGFEPHPGAESPLGVVQCFDTSKPVSPNEALSLKLPQQRHQLETKSPGTFLS